MLSKRIVARLDIKGPNLVKGIHLEGLRVLGKPQDFARHYYNTGADELIFMDVVASLYNRNSLVEIISKTAKEIFIPLIVGGGLRTIEDISKVLRAGADKVSINTAAVNNPEIIKMASRTFGSSTIIVSIETIKQPDGKYVVYTDNGRNYTGLDAVKWAQKAQDLGAGEILITSVDNEGTGQGLDMEIINQITRNLSIPVIAHGGIGELSHIYDVFCNKKVDAIAIASILHYDFVKNIESVRDFSKEGNLEFLKSGRIHSKIKPSSIQDLKNYLESKNICIRNNLQSKNSI